MKQYTVTGMSCAACSARVEKAVGKVPGVDSCSVSLLTNSMAVEGDVSPQDVIGGGVWSLREGKEFGPGQPGSSLWGRGGDA